MSHCQTWDRWVAARLYAVVLTLKTSALFALTAVAEILGCYLPYLWLKRQGSPWLLLPATASLVLFVWLLTLHPTASGRVYAAYGGVYVATAVIWLWLVDGIRPTGADLVGAALMLVGTSVIVWGGWKH
jgi:small multidrug resistance family-3 protein